MVALAVALVALIACAVCALFFWQGKGLLLVAGRPHDEESLVADQDSPNGRERLARRMTFVLLIGCLLIATLIVYEAAKLAANTSLVAAFTLINNVCFVALIIALIWFFIVQRPAKEEKDPEKQESAVSARARSAQLDHLPLATILFVIAFLFVIGLVGVLFSL